MTSNLRLPYSVYRDDELVYRFVAESGVEYTAYFIDISEAFGVEGVYSFSFDAKGKGKKDDRIRVTIINILRDFFEMSENVMIVVCDSEDRREEARFRLFQRWYDELEQERVEKVDVSLKGEGYCILSSLFIARKHPRKEEIRRIFEGYAKERVGK